MPANLQEKQAARLKAKMSRPPELVVFEKVSEDGKCSECGVDLLLGGFLIMEKGQPLCLACADMDRLIFLPAGDTALTRRARKHSALSAAVVRFSRARKRYERQGVLVVEDTLARAETGCAADASEREAARTRAGMVRGEDDREYVTALTEAILQCYPGCPPDTQGSAAAAGRALNPEAVDLGRGGPQPSPSSTTLPHDEPDYETTLRFTLGEAIRIVGRLRREHMIEPK